MTDPSPEHPIARECYHSLIESIEVMERRARIRVIDDLLHRLKFERRWQSLTPNQIEHMTDESLSGAERAALGACRTDAEADESLGMYARARYFRRCAWGEYLNGQAEAPVEAEE